MKALQEGCNSFEKNTLSSSTGTLHWYTHYKWQQIDDKNKFIGGGSVFRVRFFPIDNERKALVGIGNINEVTSKDVIWINGRRLNGDKEDQGRAWRFAFWQTEIEKCTMYTYQ